MNTLAYPFLWLSAIGFGLSFASHICAWLGREGPLGEYSVSLHFGVFVVWLPAVLALRTLTRNSPHEDIWQAALRGCPTWMRLAVSVVFGYTMLNFLVFLASTVSTKQGSGPMPPAIVRGFSGHWMLFYGVAYATLYSFIRLGGQEPARKCPSGHEVGPIAQSCKQCGAAVPERLPIA